MKIVSWNIEGRLSNLATDDRGTPSQIVAAIKALDADIIVHPEAFGMRPSVSAEIEKALDDLGYGRVSTPYDDLVSRGEQAVVPDPHLMVLTRLPIVSYEVIRPGNLRNMLSVTVKERESGRELRVIAVHLEDREEVLRLKQVRPLVSYVNDSGLPTIMMGDFNAMPPGTAKSRLIHSGLFRDPATLIPHKHLRYVLKRLSDMASGTTISTILRETALINTDPLLQATTTPKMRRMEWMPSWRLAKIDWIFATPDIEYKNFSISPDLGSDHRALSLEISIKDD